MVAEFTYEDTVVPDLVYFSGGTCVAFRDDGFSVFQGEDTPAESQEYRDRYPDDQSFL